MNVLLAVRDNIDSEIDTTKAAIAKAETQIEELRQHLHVLEDVRAAARMPVLALVQDRQEQVA